MTINNESVTIAMVAGEVALVFWRPEDFEEALDAGHDMGLPITTTLSVAEDLGFHPGNFDPGSAEAADMEDFDR